MAGGYKFESGRLLRIEQPKSSGVSVATVRVCLVLLVVLLALLCAAFSFLWGAFIACAAFIALAILLIVVGILLPVALQIIRQGRRRTQGSPVYRSRLNDHHASDPASERWRAAPKSMNSRSRR